MNYIQSKSKEIVTVISEVFITTLNNTGYVDKQRLADEVIRIFEYNGITQMKYTHPALDQVFTNLGLCSTLETSNAFVSNNKNL